MKRTSVILGLAFAVAASSAGLGAQPASGGKVGDDVKQTVHDATATVGEKKADYEKRIKTEMDDLDAKIRRLEKHLSKLSRESEDKQRARVQEMKKKRRAAREKIREVKAASENEWRKIKAGADAALDDLKKAYEGFEEDMTK